MTIAALPDVLQRGISIVIFALAIGMVAVQTVLAASAAARSRLERRLRPLVTACVGAYLTLWLGLAITIGDRANFPLASETLRLPVTLVVGFGPMLLAAALLFASGTLGRVYAAMPAPWLIWIQTYRMAGLMFLFPFLYYGMLPAGFAVPASLGDFLTGALAPVVALAVTRRRPHATTWAIAWNLFGILDLIAAPTAAFVSRAHVIGLYPLSLVALFFGPPLGILTHIYSLRTLAAWPSSDLADSSPSSADVERSKGRSVLRPEAS